MAGRPSAVRQGRLGKVLEFEGDLFGVGVTLAPGASSVVSVTATTPAAAGDASGAVVLNSGHGATTIPVTLRSLVSVARGGAFGGVLTGGNDDTVGAQAKYYEFSVPPGRRDVSVNLRLANDRGDQVVGYLVAPTVRRSQTGRTPTSPSRLPPARPKSTAAG